MKSIKTTVIIILSSFMLWGCTKNNVSTMTLLGEEEYVVDYDRYFNSIINAIPANYRQEFNQRLRIFDGNIPPKVEGEFIFTPKQRVYSNVKNQNWPLNVLEPDVKLKFVDQHNRVATLYHYEQYLTETDTIYLKGDAERFTAYYIETKDFDYGMNKVIIKRGIIYSGRVNEDGIKYLQYASVIMDVKDSSHGLVDTYPVGTFFIYEDGDGIARREDWYEEEGVK